MDARVAIRGAEEYDALMKAFPDRAAKAALKAMRTAAQQTARTAKAPVPRSFRSIVKGIAKDSRSRRGHDFYAVVGLVAPHRSSGGSDRYWKWIRAYWQNYGTLANRKRGHGFTAPRKRGTQDWKGGIEPRLFWDTQEERLVSEYGERLRKTYMEEIEKAYGKQE